MRAKCKHCGVEKTDFNGDEYCKQTSEVYGLRNHHDWRLPDATVPKAVSVPDLLTEMANTYRERNAVYGDNWRNVGNVMMQLFPKGIELRDADAFNTWHLFELIVVKLTRFANSGLSHADSIHDIAVYAAMIEAAIKEKSGDA